MPSNQGNKGKGAKGRNYDELSGVGTSSAGPTGTVGNLNTGGRDGGIGTPDLADEGNLQSAGGQPGGTPALGDSWRGQGNAQGGQQGSQQSGQLSGQQGSQQSGQLSNQQSGQLSADQLRGTPDDRQLGAKQQSQDEIGTAKPSKR